MQKQNDQPKRGRGRPLKEPVQPPRPGTVDSLEAIEKRIHVRTLSYIHASSQRRKMDENVRADLCRQTAMLYEHVYRLTMEKLMGRARGEELKTLPSLRGEFRRLVIQLSLADGVDVEDELEEL